MKKPKNMSKLEMLPTDPAEPVLPVPANIFEEMAKDFASLSDDEKVQAGAELQKTMYGLMNFLEQTETDNPIGKLFDEINTIDFNLLALGQKSKVTTDELLQIISHQNRVIHQLANLFISQNK